jgi:hypothetical protein
MRRAGRRHDSRIARRPLVLATSTIARSLHFGGSRFPRLPPQTASWDIFVYSPQRPNRRGAEGNAPAGLKASAGRCARRARHRSDMN